MYTLCCPNPGCVVTTFQYYYDPAPQNAKPVSAHAKLIANQVGNSLPGNTIKVCPACWTQGVEVLVKDNQVLNVKTTTNEINWS